MHPTNSNCDPNRAGRRDPKLPATDHPGSRRQQPAQHMIFQSCPRQTQVYLSRKLRSELQQDAAFDAQQLNPSPHRARTRSLKAGHYIHRLNEPWRPPRSTRRLAVGTLGRTCHHRHYIPSRKPSLRSTFRPKWTAGNALWHSLKDRPRLSLTMVGHHRFCKGFDLTDN